ncbi:MAG: EAL domain-containing protein [Gammaproteobacteria bacterium]
MPVEPKTPPTHVDVLIADPDPVTAAQSRDSVLAAGLTAQVVDDFAQLEKALQEPVRTVVLELMLADVDGIELIRYFGSMIAPPDLVIVSDAEPRIRDAARRLANARGLTVRDVLGKAFADYDQLTQVLRAPRDSPSRERGKARFVPTAAELRHGMANGEISVLFQPKVNISTLELISVEALARWLHPAHGSVSPGDFISVAEHHNLIGPLTDIVVQRAFASLRDWREQNLDTRLAINVSGASLANLKLPDHLARTTAHYGLSPERITVEITEGWIEQNPIDALDIMTRLRMKGFDLSIDDFGTGYSTMLRLKQVPFSELKLDQSLIRGAAADEVARLIVASSIELGRALGLHVVAEGVDNQDDWDLIVDLGCDEGQGYFIARPMSASAMLDWYRRWQQSLGGQAG